MQNTKDTFYEVIRQRLAALNPERTIALRGVVRPGLLVEENELLTGVPLPDCFRMSWAEATVDYEGAMPLETMTCEFRYQTAGSNGNGGMDRGRALAQMDAELMTAVAECPTRTQKMNFALLVKGDPAQAMATSIWWGSLSFGKVSTDANVLLRTASVQVMSFQEQGEL